MSESYLDDLDDWLAQPGPQQHVVMSSRVRYARNLAKVKFPPRASADELQQVCRLIREILNHHEELRGFTPYDLSALSAGERRRLCESHVISAELERAEGGRLVCINLNDNMVIMVNEEDHLRMYCMRAGFQLFPLLGEIDALEVMLGRMLPFAWHEQFGYLAACPTNTGTGIRGSVMLHLPGLVLTKRIDDLIKSVCQHGMTVRGFSGEHSDHLGDYYQVSNETTLGKKEDEIIQRLIKVAEEFIQLEENARRNVFEKNRLAVEDRIWRAFGTLRYAHRINSQEAMRLLSFIRLGVDHGLFPGLTHAGLNSLVIRIQPAHLEPATEAAELSKTQLVAARDQRRAELLRDAFTEFQS